MLTEITTVTARRQGCIACTIDSYYRFWTKVELLCLRHDAAAGETGRSQRWQQGCARAVGQYRGLATVYVNYSADFVCVVGRHGGLPTYKAMLAVGTQ